MSNQGRQNHCRFKTKYWQQQHQLAQPIAPLTTIALSTSHRRRPHSPKLTTRFSPSPAKHDPPMSREYKSRLKRQLETLNSEGFSTMNVS